ncbi:MAG TPA: class I SAM-dependent methyltransferase [Candidatus Sulfotelmatobacter sp.]|nr:class I SAM-dependent methyltransferase [Candidatus Sulfotelmatobacter sp.]
MADLKSKANIESVGDAARSDLKNGTAGTPNLNWSAISHDYLRHRPGYPKQYFTLLRQLGIGSAGQDILDLGSGTGALAIPFAGQGARVTAVDPSEGQIRAQKLAALDAGVKIKFKVGHAEKTGLPDHSFDAITASMCWTYFDVEQMKVEVPRLLRPGGLLLVSTLIWDRWEEGIFRQTLELIGKYNVEARRRQRRWDKDVVPKWSRDWLKLKTFHEYQINVPFSRESWRGRIRACRWIGPALTREQTEAFDREHAALLERIAPARFAIPHKITIRIFVNANCGMTRQRGLNKKGAKFLSADFADRRRLKL